jgi:hypothetical protein
VVTYSPAPCPLKDLLASLLEDVFLLSVNAKARNIFERGISQKISSP